MIQVLARAAALLEILAEDPETPVPLRELAARAGLNPSTGANILQALVALDLAEQAGNRGGYRLGAGVFRLARHGPYRRALVAAAGPPLARLAAATRETVLVAALHRGRRAVLLQVDGGRALTVSKKFLLQENIYSTATGRLLLAFAPAAEQAVITGARGRPDEKCWPGAQTARGLEKELATIRGEGMVRHVTAHDIVGIAFPLKEGGRVVAALGLFLPRGRFQGRHRDEVVEKAGKAAAEISATLGRGHETTDRSSNG